MTQRKESALGRGLDALIKPDVSSKHDSTEEESMIKKSPKKKSKTKTTAKSVDQQSNTLSEEDEDLFETPKSSINESLVDSVILEVHKNPRISLWSAKSAAVLRLLKKTKPEFSISKEASALIEGAVKEKYPELWEIFEDKDI